MPSLYLVATPIGNLEDITLRALEALKTVDLILCEDTRVTHKLLSHFAIATPMLSYHQHSRLTKVEEIIRQLEQGKNLALVTDAGTPGIADPGGRLISELLKVLPQLKVVPIPGTSALTALASVAGLPVDRFWFLGFPPVKKRRQAWFQEVITAKYPVIFYEAPYRIIKTLSELELLALTLKKTPQAVVGRELTKKFETIYRGELKSVIEQIQHDPIKGEFVVIIFSC